METWRERFTSYAARECASCWNYLKEHLAQPLLRTSRMVELHRRGQHSRARNLPHTVGPTPWRANDSLHADAGLCMFSGSVLL